MADYRETCSTPNCEYNGFRAHSIFCPVPGQLVQEAAARRLKHELEEDAIRIQYERMLTEDLFRAAQDARLRMEEAAIEYRAAQAEYRATLNVIRDKGIYNEFRRFDRE